jgi:uncharacterized protein (DUF1778 family)
MAYVRPCTDNVRILYHGDRQPPANAPANFEVIDMVIAREREAKAERLEVRLTPAAKSLLSHAAQLKHTTLTDFLVSSAIKAAEDVLVSPRVFEIHSEKGWNTLVDLLDEADNVAPNENLVALLKPKKMNR